MAQSEADRAYQAAVQKIEDARSAGATSIRLGMPDLGALARIPAEIAGIAALTHLSLSGTQIADLGPLARLTKLESLRLSWTKATDLAPLRGLTALTVLRLDNTAVSDIAPLSALTKLRLLELDDTRVSDLTALASLSALTTLNLRGTLVSDIRPLAGLHDLTELVLASTNVRDVSPLADNPALTELDLSGTQVVDINPIGSLPRLKRLLLDRTKVSDISALSAAKNLVSLDVVGTHVSDLRPVTDMILLSGESPVDGLNFSMTPATRNDPELERLSGINEPKERTARTLAYLKTLPPWPEPLPWLQADDPPGKTRHKPPLSPSPGPGKGLVPPAGLKRLSLADARLLLQSGHPVLRDRCQRIVAEIDDALAMLAVRIPNDPERLVEHDSLIRTLTLAKAAMVDIHDAIPENLSDQPLTDAEAGRLRAAFDAAIEKLKTAAAYVDRKDHTPTFGGLLKLGTATGVASVLAMVPGVNLGLAIPAVYACLYGADAKKALKIGTSAGN